MRKTMMLAAIAVLAACSQEATAPGAEDANVVVAETEAPAETWLNETSWEYTEDGQIFRTSIDGNGNYQRVSGDELLDHGQFAMVDGKACFTSAMNEDGPECWTVSPTEIGGTMESTSDKGNSGTDTRVEYTPFEPRA